MKTYYEIQTPKKDGNPIYGQQFDTLVTNLTLHGAYKTLKDTLAEFPDAFAMEITKVPLTLEDFPENFKVG